MDWVAPVDPNGMVSVDVDVELLPLPALANLLPKINKCATYKLRAE